VRALSILIVLLISPAIPAIASAQGTCQSATDCDGDGVPNDIDPCPALSSDDPLDGPHAPSETVLGFRDAACYAGLLPATPACIPVLVRPVDDMVPNDPLNPGAGSTRIVGFNFVGVYDVAKGGAAAALGPAVPDEVVTEARGAHPVIDGNALFACVGGVQFNPGGQLASGAPVIAYGFRLATSYAHAIADASIILAPPFSDALGLIQSVNFHPGQVLGLQGSNGNWDEASTFSTIPSTVTSPASSTLPQGQLVLRQRICLDALDPGAVLTPFGRPATVGDGTTTAVPAPAPPTEYNETGALRRVSTSSCPPTLGGRLIFPANNVVPPLIVSDNTNALFPRGGWVWQDFFPGVAQPLVLPTAVQAFEAQVGAIFAGGASRPTWLLRQPKPPTAPPFRSIQEIGSSLTAGGAFLLSNSSTTNPWQIVRGVSASALIALEAVNRPFDLVQQVDTHRSIKGLPGTFPRRELVAALRGWSVASQSFDYNLGVWKTEFITAAGMPDDFSISFDPGLVTNLDTDAYPLGTPDKTFVSVHFSADTWHPGGDYWLANAAGTKCSVSRVMPFIGTNTDNPISTDWCDENAPKFADVPELGSYETLVNTCAKDFTPDNPDEHWQRLKTRVPYAGIEGFANSPPPNVAPPSVDVPEFHLPGSDLVSGNPVGKVTDTVARLHSGNDINWTIMPDFTDPAYVDEHGSLPADGHDCFGTSVFTSSYEMPISCTDDAFRACGSDADCTTVAPADCGGDNGCNPWEKYFSAAEDTCDQSCKSHSCGFLDFICTAASCVYHGVVDCAWSYVKATGSSLYADVTSVCQLFGPSCTGDDFVLHRQVITSPQKMEHELEYRLQDGLQHEGECGTFTCEPAQFLPQYNSSNQTQVDQSLNAVGPINSGKQLPDQIWPYTWSPGIFQSAQSVWGNFATADGTSWNGVDTVSVLPDSAKQDFIDPLNGGFRIEFLGDLIADCGHEPLHTEIHPPSAILLHASTVSMRRAKRYSLFGWQRFGESDTTSFDLWPGLPNQAGGTPVVTPGLLPYATQKGVVSLDCEPIPPLAPNRIRCTFPEAAAIRQETSSEACGDNARMRPDCYNAIVGGLYEIGWDNTTPDQCADVGGACASSGDCCAPLRCVGNACVSACGNAGDSCASPGDCCTAAGLTCTRGFCATPS
jgi:hypothetical protein